LEARDSSQCDLKIVTYKGKAKIEVYCDDHQLNIASRMSREERGMGKGGGEGEGDMR